MANILELRKEFCSGKIKEPYVRRLLDSFNIDLEDYTFITQKEEKVTVENGKTQVYENGRLHSSQG